MTDKEAVAAKIVERILADISSRKVFAGVANAFWALDDDLQQAILDRWRSFAWQEQLDFSDRKPTEASAENEALRNEIARLRKDNELASDMLDEALVELCEERRRAWRAWEEQERLSRQVARFGSGNLDLAFKNQWLEAEVERQRATIEQSDKDRRALIDVVIKMSLVFAAADRLFTAHDDPDPRVSGEASFQANLKALREAVKGAKAEQGALVPCANPGATSDPFRDWTCERTEPDGRKVRAV